ncbi:hypothetical protein JCM33374_g1011 [Metschnikowia sp. JCM 33374]|nr:hypothetical protein JCM33374_g1011 [Metschnikowia sp. JCM 33374]
MKWGFIIKPATVVESSHPDNTTTAELPNPDLVNVCQVETPTNVTGNIDQQFNKFFQSLKSFVTIWGFDVKSFGHHISSLRKHLRHITSITPTLPSKEYPAKISFARNSLQLMVNALDIRQHYNVFHNPHDDLLYRVVELRLKLLTFHNTNGEPRQHLNSHNMYDIFKLWHSLSFWKTIFKQLPNVPIDTRVIFDSQVRRAKKTITYLISSAPQSH